MGVKATGAGDRLGGRFRLEEQVGAGGMATVWRAEDEQLGRAVAVKFLSETLASDPGYVARFSREARIAATVTHPNLVEVFDVDADAERPYLVMEYVAGGTLADLVERGERPPREIARELLSALAAIHEAGIIHRDIKPENVLVDTERRLHLTDFGIARAKDATKLTRTGEVVGTIRYLAPEIRDGGEANVRSDLYALGIVLRESFRGMPPQDVADVAAWMIEPDPRERPPSAVDALRELDRAESLVSRVLADTEPVIRDLPSRREATPVRRETASDAPVEPARALAQRRFVHVSAARVTVGALLGAGLVALAASANAPGGDSGPLIGPAAPGAVNRGEERSPQPDRPGTADDADDGPVLELGGRDATADGEPDGGGEATPRR